MGLLATIVPFALKAATTVLPMVGQLFGGSQDEAPALPTPPPPPSVGEAPLLTADSDIANSIRERKRRSTKSKKAGIANFQASQEEEDKPKRSSLLGE